MTAEHDAVWARLGPVGVWSFAFDSLPADDVRRTAREIESLGYPSLWVPEGGGSREISYRASKWNLLDDYESDPCDRTGTCVYHYYAFVCDQGGACGGSIHGTFTVLRGRG